MKAFKMKVVTSTIGLAALLPLQIQAVDLTNGGVLTIRSGTFTNTTRSTFPVVSVVSNTLLASPPQNSNIIAPIAGNYIATTTVFTCVSGAKDYINAYVVVNGNEVAVAVNGAYASECVSATATAAIYVQKGGIISGQCRINGGMASTCSFALALLH